MSQPARPTVWILDDSALERATTAACLENLYHVETFSDGAELLEQIEAGALPDVLLLDWVMPNLSGLQVLEFLRGRAVARSLGVIVVTSATGTDDLSTALRAGADDFVRKPVHGGELRARLGRFIERRQANDLVERGLAHGWNQERELVIAERRQREEAVEQRKLAELFMAVLGHDLRTPLSAVLLATASLERDDLSTEARSVAVRRIRNSVARMVELVGRVLDLTRVRLAGGIVLERGLHDVRRVCEQVVDEVRAANPQRHVEFLASGTTSFSIDPARFAQVVANLVSNAIQHGLAGDPIEVRLHGNDDRIEFAVSNSGAPIPQPLAATLFEPFHRGNGSGSDRTAKPLDSMGLGLYISKQIVEAHGGRIDLRSDEAKTIFSVTVPRDTALLEPPPPGAAAGSA